MAADEVERTVGLVRDREPVEYVEAIGIRLSRSGTCRHLLAVERRRQARCERVHRARPLGVRHPRLAGAVKGRERTGGVYWPMKWRVLEGHAANRVGAAIPLAVLFGVLERDRPEKVTVFERYRRGAGPTPNPR
jgi:hypothetical protein